MDVEIVIVRVKIVGFLFVVIVMDMVSGISRIVVFILDIIKVNLVVKIVNFI